MKPKPRGSQQGAPVTHFLWLLTYVAFVIYGSLVPLDFHALPLSSAWEQFQRIPMLQLGIESRADWVANGVLYLPVGFLATNLLLGNRRKRSGTGTIASFLAALTFSCLLAVAVEFVQIFFPARTVSLNDILAECLGSLLGIILAMRYTDWFRALISAHKGASADSNASVAPAQIANLFLQTYLALFVAYSLFPYDFLLSAGELNDKLHSGQWSWWIAPDAYQDGRLWTALRLAIEIVATLPFGIFLARQGKSERSGLAKALIFGALLGTFIEFAQLLTASGVAQGLSVVTRAIGCWLGTRLWQTRTTFPQARIENMIRRMTFPLAPVYLASIAVLNGWFKHPWHGLDRAFDALAEVHFQPFYYHYYTTESAALISLVSVAGQYAPIGLATWAHRQRPALAGVLALLLAMALEISRLFIAGTHADPTNILIAAVSAWLFAAFIPHLLRSFEAENIKRQKPPAASHSATDSRAAAQDAPLAQGRATAAKQTGETARSRLAINPLALLCAGALTVALANYPLDLLWPACSLLAYLLILHRWPHAWLIALPAALPILDLAPWTGRFFFDEFDALVLATIAIAGWRRPTNKISWRAPSMSLLLASVFAISLASAMLIGAYPYPALDLNSFSNYHSPYNALRVGKGLLWALLLLPLLNLELNRNLERTHRLFAGGMTAGVLTAGMTVLWERLAFTGLFDFSQDYRAVGMFSGTHTGGAYLEAFLVAALPFAAWWTLMNRRWMGRLLGAAVFALGCYAVMVTYARAGHIALALSLAVLAIGLLLGKPVSLTPRRAAGGAALSLLVIAIAWPVMQGSFMQNRLAKTGHDFHTRIAHWTDAQRMMIDDGPLTVIFGKGLGRYQETYFWKSAEGIHPTTYGFVQETGKAHLVLGAGSPLYIEQLVDIKPGQHYRLTVSSRGKVEKSELSLSICEKWMLYSASCIWHNIPVGNTNGQWQSAMLDLDTGKLPVHPWYERPTIKLSLLNPTSGSNLDIRQVSLQSDDGKEWLQNGDFSGGMDHWFFSIDNDLPWHIENLWMQIYFEQGLVGLILFVCLLAYTFNILAKRYADKGLPIAALAAALVGFLTVGVVDSLFDSPRMAVLFYILLAFSVLHSRHRRST